MADDAAGAGRRAADVGGDGVTATEERAAEGLVVAPAHRLRHRDVVGQADELAVVVLRAVVDKSGEQIPFVRVADGIGVKCRTAAGECSNHIVRAVKQDAFQVGRQQAVVLHQAAEVGGG
ncbi:MAG: hypothetical protein IJ633_01940 [Prevotella sp.]|nr:hypothetical protein [Prevotella sp.]